MRMQRPASSMDPCEVILVGVIQPGAPMVHGGIDLPVHPLPEVEVALAHITRLRWEAQTLAHVLQDCLWIATRVVEAPLQVVLRPQHAELQQREKLLCVLPHCDHAIQDGLPENLKGSMVDRPQHLHKLLGELEAIRVLEAAHLLQCLATRRPTKHEPEVHVEDVALVVDQNVAIVSVANGEHIAYDGIRSHRPDEVCDGLAQWHLP
mmetsp:Transcript_61307/g.138345  ORF Transcript_61307/g.138345 Transcript_61307/m.138345 type:complete len:207 (+) Transcript_61307:74-694(+)